MAYGISVETVPVYIAMFFIVPLTYDAIKVVLEDKLDFDVIINRNMLRILEAIIAVMIFPSAAVFSICLATYYVVKRSYNTACSLVDFLTTPAFFSTAGYYVSLITTFLAIQILIVLLIKFVYGAL